MERAINFCFVVRLGTASHLVRFVIDGTILFLRLDYLLKGKMTKPDLFGDSVLNASNREKMCTVTVHSAVESNEWLLFIFDLMSSSVQGVLRQSRDRLCRESTKEGKTTYTDATHFFGVQLIRFIS